MSEFRCIQGRVRAATTSISLADVSQDALDRAGVGPPYQPCIVLSLHGPAGESYGALLPPDQAAKLGEVLIQKARLLPAREAPSPAESTDLRFGRYVRGRRERLGMTQSELARKLGCDPATIYQVERNSSVPREPVFSRLAEAIEADQQLYDRLAAERRRQRKPRGRKKRTA
ncbi:MAG: helix-turn-helix transcriptional regulator [Planctomycetota bacterium]